MNKGLFIHLMVTLAVIISYLFIMQDQDGGIVGRAVLIFIIALANLFCFLFIEDTRYYKEKINL